VSLRQMWSIYLKIAVMPTNRIIFDANCLNWLILSANSNLLSVFEQHAEAMLDAMNRKDDYTRQVVQAIAQQLKGELPSIEAIARSLAISVRQLQRELQVEGTSFQQLLKKPHPSLYGDLGIGQPRMGHRTHARCPMPQEMADGFPPHPSVYGDSSRFLC